MVGRVGALISMHQMNLSSYVVQKRCIEMRSHRHRFLSHLLRLRRCDRVLVHEWRYSRCIEIRPRAHRLLSHQRRLRRFVVQHLLTNGLCQMHRDTTSGASPFPHLWRLRRLVSRTSSRMALWQMHGDTTSRASRSSSASMAAPPPCRPVPVTRVTL